MTNYTVRVELHDADEEEYESLHEAMASEGFVRWIQSQQEKFRLPAAEYNLINSPLSKEAVRDKALAAAEQAKPRPKPWVLVTQSDGRCWSGLESWEG